MLSFIRRCRAPLYLSNYSFAPYLCTEHSSVAAAANFSIDDDPITESPTQTPAPNPIGEVTDRLRTFGLKEFVGSRYSILSRLDQFQVDSIIYDLKYESPDLVFGFFNLLRDEYWFQHSRFSWLLVSHVLAGDRRFRQLGSVLQALLEEEGPGSAPQLCEILSLNFLDWTSNSVVWDALAFAYSRKKMVTDARFILDTIKGFNIQPSVPTYNMLLHNLRHSATMWEVYTEFKHTGSPTSEYTDSIILDGLCKQSKWQEAVSFILEKEQVTHSVVSFNTIMSEFCRMGFLDVAQLFFCVMLKYGLPPDVYSYNILIHGLFIAGLMEEAMEFAHDMERSGIGPDLVTYNVILKGFHLLGPIDGAWRLLDKMLLDGLNPSLVSCLIMEFLCKNGRVLDALRFLHETEFVGLSYHSVIYSVLIHWLCRHGETQKAMALYQQWTPPDTLAQSSLLSSLSLQQSRIFFETLRRANPVEDIVWYNIMIDRFVKIGNTEAGLILFGQVLTRGVGPTVVTLNSLIYGFCKQGKFSEARLWFDSIENSTGENPSSISYTILMDAYSEENGKMETIMDLFKEMKAENVTPTFVTYTVIIKALCKELRLQESIQWLKEMYDTGLKPDQITYNIIIHCAFQVKNIQLALDLYSEMVLLDLSPTTATHNVLINGLCMQGGNLHRADMFFDSLQHRNIGKLAYTTLIKAHCVKGSISKARKYFCEMMDMGYEVSIQDYVAVINRLCKRCLSYEAKHVFYQMLHNGYMPDHEVCEILMNGFHQSGDWESRACLVCKMIKFGLLVPD